MKVKLLVCLGCILAAITIALGAQTLAAGQEVVLPVFSIVIGFAALVILWWGHGKRRA